MSANFFGFITKAFFTPSLRYILFKDFLLHKQNIFFNTFFKSKVQATNTNVYM